MREHWPSRGPWVSAPASSLGRQEPRWQQRHSGTGPTAAVIPCRVTALAVSRAVSSPQAPECPETEETRGSCQRPREGVSSGKALEAQWWNPSSECGASPLGSHVYRKPPHSQGPSCRSETGPCLPCPELSSTMAQRSPEPGTRSPGHQHASCIEETLRSEGPARIPRTQ